MAIAGFHSRLHYLGLAFALTQSFSKYWAAASVCTVITVE